MQHLLELFVTEHCFGCPDARRVVQACAVEGSNVRVVERDLAVPADLDAAIGYQLIATPALVIDRKIVMYGVPRLESLRARLADPNS